MNITGPLTRASTVVAMAKALRLSTNSATMPSTNATGIDANPATPQVAL